MGFDPKGGKCRLVKVSMITAANALVPSLKEWSRAHPGAYDAQKHDRCAAAPAAPRMWSLHSKSVLVSVHGVANFDHAATAGLQVI